MLVLILGFIWSCDWILTNMFTICFSCRRAVSYGGIITSQSKPKEREHCLGAALPGPGGL